MNKYDSELFGDGRFPLAPLDPAAAAAAEKPIQAAAPLNDGAQPATDSNVAGADSVAGEDSKAQPSSRRALDESAKRLLASAVSRGYTRREAAAFVGCHLRTIQRERKRDPEFHAALIKAEHLAGCEAKDVVVQAARNNWRAAAFLLKHMLVLEDRAAEAQKLRKRKKSRRSRVSLP